NRPLVAQARGLPWPKLQRLLTHEGAYELLALHEAIAGPEDRALAFCRERLAWPAERLNPLPLVDGSDLIRHGLKPGPRWAAPFDRTRRARRDWEIKSRDEGLGLGEWLIGQDKRAG